MIDISILLDKNNQFGVKDIEGNRDYFINIDKYKTYKKFIVVDDKVIGFTSDDVYKDFFDNILETESNLKILKDTIVNIYNEGSLVIGLTDHILIKNIKKDYNLHRNFFYYIINGKLLILFRTEFDSDKTHNIMAASYYEAIEELWYLIIAYLFIKSPSKMFNIFLSKLTTYYIEIFKNIIKNVYGKYGIIKDLINYIFYLNLYMYHCVNFDENELEKIVSKLKNELEPFPGLVYLIDKKYEITDEEFNSEILIDITKIVRYSLKNVLNIDVRNNMTNIIFNIPYIISQYLFRNRSDNMILDHIKKINEVYYG